MAIAIAFGCLPETEDQTLMLKIPQTIDTGYGGTELEVSTSM